MVALEKCCVLICCCMGFTRNWETWGDRSWSHDSVVSVRALTIIRIEWVMLYIGRASGGRVCQFCSVVKKKIVGEGGIVKKKS